MVEDPSYSSVVAKTPESSPPKLNADEADPQPASNLLFVFIEVTVVHVSPANSYFCVIIDVAAYPPNCREVADVEFEVPNC